ncbi:allantoinase AllB [Mitsuokella multacida]|uniref:allantoinase AllB n=1 Tax=Mitsuokella multacida TaxID=52226 RepID=UPI003F5EB8D8
MSNTYSLLIRGGKVMLPEGMQQVDIAVEGEKIVEIGPSLSGSADREIDATGKVVFPGTFDGHVHFDEPGRTEWETIKDGSAGLAAGGGTTFIDMPLNSSPCLLDKEEFQKKYDIASHDSYTDFGFWGGLTPDNLDRLEELAACGVVGFKAFSCYSGIPEFKGIDDYSALKGMEIIKRLGLPLMVHCENDRLTAKLGAEQESAGHDDAWAYFAAHAPITEIESITRMITFAEETGVKLIIAHASLAKSIDIINAARARGVDVSVETIGQYLILTDEEVAALGPVAKCSPPVRSKENQPLMWAHLLAGDIDYVDSDHSPSDPSMKEDVSFMKAWGGIASVQHTLTGLLTHGYHARKVPLERIMKLTCENMPGSLRIEGKGKIAVGYDADFALIDLDREYILKADDILYKHHVSPYMGMRFKGAVDETILRGQTIMRDGKIIGTPRGRMIMCKG